MYSLSTHVSLKDVKEEKMSVDDEEDYNAETDVDEDENDDKKKKLVAAVVKEEEEEEKEKEKENSVNNTVVGRHSYNKVGVTRRIMSYVPYHMVHMTPLLLFSEGHSPLATIESVDMRDTAT